MCTSVPQTPARRTLIKTSSSRMRGSGTSLRTKPGPADAFTNAFTRVSLRNGSARASMCCARATKPDIALHEREVSACLPGVACARELDDFSDQRVIGEAALVCRARELRLALQIAVGIDLDHADLTAGRDAQVDAGIVAQPQRVERFHRGALHCLRDRILEVRRDDGFGSRELGGARGAIAGAAAVGAPFRIPEIGRAHV